MTNYIEFQEIINTITQAGYNYQADMQKPLANLAKRKSRNNFTLQEHVEALVLALLSNMRPWEDVVPKLPQIKAIFHDYDPEYLKNVDPEVLIDQVKAIKAGNLQIRSQLKNLKANIEMLEKIAADHGGEIDDYYNNTPKYEVLMALSKPNGKYKLKTVGMPLACEYLKNLGVDLVKPDRHLCRIIARLGYSKRNPAGEQETMEICHDIAVAYGMTDIEVDSILWQFCADGYFAQCTNTPDCSKCLVKNCAYKNQP